MTITGIIAEFNPFHNGHKYLLDQAEGTENHCHVWEFSAKRRAAILISGHGPRWRWKMERIW